MQQKFKKRYAILIFSVALLCVGAWFGIFLQRRQNFIGGGLSRIFLFLLINAHLIVSVILLYLIIRQSIKLYIERRREVPGSAFKRNLFFAFIIFSVLPVIFVFFVAGKFISTSIDSWFQVRIGAALENGLYLHEEQTKQERTQINFAGDLVVDRLHGAWHDKELLQERIAALKKDHAHIREYQVYVWQVDGPSLGSIGDEAVIWRRFRKVNDRSTKSLRLQFLQKCAADIKQNVVFDLYGSLYWTKSVEPGVRVVLAYRYPEEVRYPLIQMQNAVEDYHQLKLISSPMYWSYFLTFLLITLLVLFLSIWCAFFLARGISKPIQELLFAIRKIKQGDLKARVTVEPTSDLNRLVSGFNDMTSSLQRAYEHLEFRNEEMLTMLGHIKESVFFVNNYGRIISFNPAAKHLVNKYLGISRFKNKKINFFGPFITETFFTLIKRLKESGKMHITKELAFSYDGEQKTFMIYLTSIKNAVLAQNRGVLVVVEDMSDLYKMNKIKTWQEAAKQMAHEIKNPLTPIQLATQRLQRKLRKKGAEEPVLMDCAETILYQVKIIKDLVSHFSEFAQMPGVVIEQLDINVIIKEVVALYEMSYPDILFTYNLQKFLPAFKADKKKMKRALVNLLDNSVRVLQERMESGVRGEISIKTSFKTGRNQIELLIADNGPGISQDVRKTLFLPYVSSESKNMGLGLAIVHEIITQIGGSIKLLPASEGAAFQILLPV